MNYFIFKQIAVLPPGTFSDADIAFIAPRVGFLTCGATDLSGWSEELGCAAEPPSAVADRAVVRAELDAYIARLYRLNREELMYVLDPKERFGDDYPSQTFRVLMENEIRVFGEYRTRRLVLEAWDRLSGTA